MPLTRHASTKLTDHLLGNGAFAMPSQIWLGLHTASPTTSGSLDDEIGVVGTGYARADVTGKMSLADLLTGLSVLTDAINLGPALADWGTITHISISDAPSGGNMLFFGSLSEAQVISSGGTFQRVAGQIQFRIV
ncbi:hypothetical protein [Shinella sp.]|uniref:phage tail fiber protein n=1 Tax=Shinella sp. TaxID=1870904 RepID=UPI0029AEC504|nr:hypothetical protein [Shinella sp.]MDX3973304.1 hypothetical protein [Shinella sp.]